MGAEISTGFTLQSPAGHDSNFKILPPSYAQVVSAAPAYGVPSTDYATWAVDSKALAQTAPDLTQEITMRMKYREDASTPVVSYDTSTEKGVDIQVVLDMQDEYNAELSVEVGIYYIDAATMSNWGINLLDISIHSTGHR